MKHVKKMALVPEHLAQQMVAAQREEQQLTSNTPVVQLSSLDREIQKVLNSKQPADVKAKQYARLLQMFSTIRHKFISPSYGQTSAVEDYADHGTPEPPEPVTPEPVMPQQTIRLEKSSIPYGRRVPMSPQPSPPTSPLPSDSLPNHLKRNKRRSKPYDRVRSRPLTIEPSSPPQAPRQPSPPRQITPPPPTRRHVFKRKNDGTGPAAKKANVKYGVKRDHDIELRRGVIKKKPKSNNQPWIER